jgi:hypothetical protein
MSATEFKVRLAKTNDEITKLTSELEEFKARKVQWLTAAKPARDMRPLNEELRVGQQHLEDLAITKAALEGKLRIYAQNAPLGEKLRVDANAAYEAGRALVDKIIKTQEEVAAYVKRILELNTLVSHQGQQHLDLLGEGMNEPHLEAPLQAWAFAGPGVQPIRPFGPWQYISEEERAASLQEEGVRRMKLQEERARVAQAHAPPCPDCGKPMNLHVDRSWKEKLGESPITRGHWSFQHCNTRLDHVVPETK